MMLDDLIWFVMTDKYAYFDFKAQALFGLYVYNKQWTD